jgi:hypothetical protein
MDKIKWQKFSNDAFKKEFDRMIQTRNSIAHGRAVAVRLGTLRRWKTMVENFAPRLEFHVADHIQQAGRPRPNW